MIKKIVQPFKIQDMNKVSKEQYEFALATIAINKIGISKYIVNDMLNHVDTSMKITELYYFS